MTRDERNPLSIWSISPEIGHGNPLTAIALARLVNDKNLAASCHLIFGGLLGPIQKSHAIMTQSNITSEIYTEKSEKLRGGIAGIAIGMIQLAQWLVNERLPLRNLADMGIFVQEHLLGVIPPEFLKRLFPRGIFLYIPDVFPKESAVAILKRFKHIITPLVWNKSAWQYLSDQGLSPTLVAPVLPTAFLKNKNYLGKRNSGESNQKKIVIKTSGSGISKKLKELDQWLKENIIPPSELPGQKIKIEYWQPNKVVIYRGGDGYSMRESSEIPDLTDYGDRFYRSLLDADQIISYPSEMIQVVAWLKAHGWQGEFFALPPRGAHEKRNLEWAIKMGIVAGVYEDGKFNPTESTFNPEDLQNELGKTSIKKFVESLIEFQRNPFLQERVGFSSEALKGLPSILLPFGPQELVIDSADKLQEIDDYSNFFGIHYRRKKREGFWEDLAEVFKKLKEHQEKLPPAFYVSFHLEDLSLLSDEEVGEKLRWLEEEASKIGIDILLENTTPRVDRGLLKESYSLIAFYNKHATLMEQGQLPHLGFCLDIAHLGLAEPEVFLVLEKYYQAKEEGLPYPTMRLNDEERRLFQAFQSVLAKTKVIHWSRAKGLNPIEKRRFFRVFKRLSGLILKEELKEKAHNFYSLLENIFSAHYPIATNSDLFVTIFTIVKDLGWEGKIVIESPAILEMVRSHQRPFNYSDRLQFLSSRPAEIDLDYFSRGQISRLDLKDLATFIEPEYSSLPPHFFPFLQKAFPLILSIYNHQRRKVNGGLYLRHILKTTIIAYRLANTFGFDDGIKERIILGALLHDAFEMNQSYNETILSDQLRKIFPEKDDQRIRTIVGDVRFLTPSPKDSPLSYLERKREDFNRFIPQKPFDWWSEDEKLRFLIKVADIYANLYETVGDLDNAMRDDLMDKPLDSRYLVFKERWQLIKQVLPSSVASSLVDSFEGLLKELYEFVNKSRETNPARTNKTD